jgi:hypothetical protein
LDAPFYQPVIDTYNEQKSRTLAKIFAGNDAVHLPTLIGLHTMHMSEARAYREDPNSIYVDKGGRGLWAGLFKQFSENVSLANAAWFRCAQGSRPLR